MQFDSGYKMLCSNCSKLSLNAAQRVCVRCKGTILNNIAVICDGCSKIENMCSICLKKLINQTVARRHKSNCSSCGKK